MANNELSKFDKWNQSLSVRTSRFLAFACSGLIAANIVIGGCIVSLGVSKWIVYPIGGVFGVLCLAGIALFYKNKPKQG
ncbi:hypothetical protein OKZ62_001774 [Vibrio navarrensis]|nr:hypothetical protein [Vibrio navarrensis]